MKKSAAVNLLSLCLIWPGIPPSLQLQGGHSQSRFLSLYSAAIEPPHTSCHQRWQWSHKSQSNTSVTLLIFSCGGSSSPQPVQGSTVFFFCFFRLLVTVPMDCMVLHWVPHPDFLVFLTERGGERTLFEEEAMMRLPCSGRGQVVWCLLSPPRARLFGLAAAIGFQQLN